MDEVVRSVFKGLLACFNYCYQKLETGLGSASLVRRRGGEAVIVGSTVAPLPSLLATGIITARIRFIRKRCVAICFWDGCLVVGYFRLRARVSGSINPSCRNSILYFHLFLLIRLSYLHKSFSDLDLSEGDLLDLVHYEFGHEHCKGRVSINFAASVSTIGSSRSCLCTVSPTD